MIFYSQVQLFVKFYLVCYFDSQSIVLHSFPIYKKRFYNLPYPRDKDFVRIVWFKDLDKLNVDNIETAEYQTYHLCHVLFGFSSSQLF